MWFHVILRNTKGSPAFRSKVSTLNYPGCTTCCETDSLNDPIQKSRSTFFGDSPALHLLVRPFSSHSRNTQLPPVAHAPSTAAVASRPVALMLRCHNNRPPSSAACAAWTWEAGERHILSYIYILYIYIYTRTLRQVTDRDLRQGPTTLNSQPGQEGAGTYPKEAKGSKGLRTWKLRGSHFYIFF